MTKREHAMPEPNRTTSEIEFVLRNAKHKRGPELMRDLARADDKAPSAIRYRAKPAKAAPKPRKRGR